MALVLPPLAADRVFLCGAGISAPSPSELKPVGRFLQELHCEMRSQTGINSRILDQVIRGNSIYRPLRFEQVVSCLSDVDPTLSCLDYLLVRRKGSLFTPSPNSYHYFLAEQWQAGALILTTNFDILIEVAYNLLYGTANAPAGSLVKLHGTIQTIDDGLIYDADRSELKADIRSVAENNAIASVSDRLAKIAQSVSHRHLYVFGYSFSDSFDITPLLESSRPLSAHVFEFTPQPPEKISISDSRDLRDFSRIATTWESVGLTAELWQGDPALTFVPSSPVPSAASPTASSPMPFYSAEQLCYTVARLLIYQDALDEANGILSDLIRDEPKCFGGRAAFYWARTLPDWGHMLEQEDYLRAILPDNATGWRIFILLLDAAAFVGDHKRFLRIYKDFCLHMRAHGSRESERERILFRGKAYHAVGNFLLNVGRSRWAEKALRKSIDLRTQSGEPSDIFFAEFGLCLAQAHQGNADALFARLPDMTAYAEKIDDISSKICIAILNGLALFLREDFVSAEVSLRDARQLYQLGEDDRQIDPELELYILACEIRLAYPPSATSAHLASVKSYVYTNRYAFFYDVVEAFDEYLSSGIAPLQLSRLSRRYFRMAGLQCDGPEIQPA